MLWRGRGVRVWLTWSLRSWDFRKGDCANLACYNQKCFSRWRNAHFTNSVHHGNNFFPRKNALPFLAKLSPRKLKIWSTFQFGTKLTQNLPNLPTAFLSVQLLRNTPVMRRLGWETQPTTFTWRWKILTCYPQ